MDQSRAETSTLLVNVPEHPQFGHESAFRRRKSLRRQKLIGLGIEPRIFWFVVRRLAIGPHDRILGWHLEQEIELTEQSCKCGYHSTSTPETSCLECTPDAIAWLLVIYVIVIWSSYTVLVSCNRQSWKCVSSHCLSGSHVTTDAAWQLLLVVVCHTIQ